MPSPAGEGGPKSCGATERWMRCLAAYSRAESKVCHSEPKGRVAHRESKDPAVDIIKAPPMGELSATLTERAKPPLTQGRLNVASPCFVAQGRLDVASIYCAGEAQHLIRHGCAVPPSPTGEGLKQSPRDPVLCTPLRGSMCARSAHLLRMTRAFPCKGRGTTKWWMSSLNKQDNT